MREACSTSYRWECMSSHAVSSIFESAGHQFVTGQAAPAIRTCHVC